MACKSEIEETPKYDYLDVQSFVYEVFVHSAVKFGVARSCIPKWEGEVIPDKHRRIIPVISRIIFKYQITERKSWSCEFNTHHLLHGFRTWQLTRNLLMEVLRVSMKSVGCIRHKMLISLAVMNEFVLFLYANDYDFQLKTLVVFYEWYMSTSWEKLQKFGRLLHPSEITGPLLEEYVKAGGLWKEFEEAGGHSVIVNGLIYTEFESVDVFYHKFIPEFCIPYHNEDKLPRLRYTFYDKSIEFFREITKNLSGTDRRNYNTVFNITVWRDCRIWPRIELATSYASNLGILSVFSPHVFLSELHKIPEKELWKLKPENASPLLPHYDRWLLQRKVNMNLESCVYSFLDHLDTILEEPASNRKSPGQEEKRKTKSSSRSIVEDFGQLNLDPSYSRSWNLKPENIGFQIGSNLNIDTSPPEKARDRRRSSQGARRKTKSSSYSGVKDFSQFNLGLSETKSCIPKPVNIGLGIQSPEESLLDVDASVVGAATSSQNSPGARPQVVAIDSGGSISPEEGEMRKSSSLLSLEERFAQLNLGPSETERSSEKKN